MKFIKSFVIIVLYFHYKYIYLGSWTTIFTIVNGLVRRALLCSSFEKKAVRATSHSHVSTRTVWRACFMVTLYCKREGATASERAMVRATCYFEEIKTSNIRQVVKLSYKNFYWAALSLSFRRTSNFYLYVYEHNSLESPGN